ncbi:MAG: hypothetical protein M1358_01955 [Chloroflexi bacterium]|nr:hypothetical protein [Chloroflexota bacterium]
MRRIGSLVKGVLALGLLVMPLLGPGNALAAPSPWNDANFQSVWERTDKPIEDGATSRSWMWGPQTVPGSPGTEPYAEAPGGNRVVQYFDKSRMEVNNSNGDRSQLWFVTTGLIVKEMVSGRTQVGESTFMDNSPSDEAVAGDPASGNPDAPTYASFKNVATLDNDNQKDAKTGIVNEFIDKAGTVTSGTSPDANVTYAYFDDNLKHNIPNVLWDYMNQSGVVYWNGATSTEKVIDWVFAMGFPITEPYWIKAKVGGVEKDVLVQLFQRRVLTYTPSNDKAYQVEMGNVGQHYKRWRYDTGTSGERIAFASNRTGSYQIFTMNPTGGEVKQLTSAGNNRWPSWSPDNKKIAFQTDRDGNWEIYSMNADGSGQARLTNSAGEADEQPNWSPDGSRIIWSKGARIYSMLTDGTGSVMMSGWAGNQLYPLYSPNGQKIAYATDSGIGGFTVQTLHGAAMSLAYHLGGRANPTDWQGNNILFHIVTGGQGELWSMNDNNTNFLSLTGGNALRARYSPDSSRIVFQQGGQVWTIDSSGTNQKQVTSGAESVFNGEPDWSN